MKVYARISTMADHQRADGRGVKGYSESGQSERGKASGTYLYIRWHQRTGEGLGSVLFILILQNGFKNEAIERHAIKSCIIPPPPPPSTARQYI